MCELIACYIMATYFLPAFKVIGFLWSNGDRGSGKTQLLNVVCEMAYLGQVLLAGGSYAALRDLADYGACLAFDDAENVSDPLRMDPDKRALLLAGNRRGAQVPLKEPDGKKAWRTRWVSTFCPRLFSAINSPDPVLASRSIVVPLVRTPDRRRANADALDFAMWPHDRRPLVDELWAVSLAAPPQHAGLRVPGQPAVRARRGATWSRGARCSPWRSGWRRAPPQMPAAAMAPTAAMSPARTSPAYSSA